MFYEGYGFETMMICWWVDLLSGYLERDLNWLCYKLYFYDMGFMFDLWTELCLIFDRIFSVRNFLISWFYISLQVSFFQMGLGINISYRFLGGVPRNRDPLKDTWQSPHVRIPSQGVTFLDKYYHIRVKIKSNWK